MSEERKEKVSALVDGELGSDSESVIDDLLKTPLLKESWARYHLISDSLQQNIPEAIDTGMVTRVSATIEKEPFILAPTTSPKSSFFKPLTGFAIAASVAAMAILAIQQNQDEVTVQQQQIVSFTPRSTINTVPAQQASLNLATQTQLQQVRENSRARLNSYLVNYNEYRSNSGFQGMLPYARTVTFENNQ